MKREIILKTLIIIFFILLIPSIAFADTIFLKDGSVIKGDIIEVKEASVIIRTNVGIFEIYKSNIERIEFEFKQPQEESKDNDIYTQIREKVKEALENLQGDENTPVIVILVIIEKEVSSTNNNIDTTINNNTNETENNNTTVNDTTNENENTNTTNENENTNTNDDYNWANENDTQKDKKKDTNFYIGAGVKMGFGFTPEFNLIDFSFITLDFGFSLTPFMYMSFVVGFPIGDPYYSFLSTGFSGSFGITFVLPSNGNLFYSGKYFHITVENVARFLIGLQVDFMYLMNSSYFAGGVSLNIASNFKIKFIEFVNEFSVIFNFIPEFFIGGYGRIGIRFYI